MNSATEVQLLPNEPWTLCIGHAIFGLLRDTWEQVYFGHNNSDETAEITLFFQGSTFSIGWSCPFGNASDYCFASQR